MKDSPLPTTFVSTKKDCPMVYAKLKELIVWFANLNYRSVIDALLYVLCCTCPDITYAINKLAKYAGNPDNPDITYYQSLLHLVWFIKRNSNKGLEFYQDVYKAQLYSVIRGNNLKFSRGSIMIFTE